MQVQPQQIVCPKPTDAQIQAQIENMHWQQKQAEQSNTASLQYQKAQQVMEQQKISINHTEYMVDHLALPGAGVSVALIAAFVVLRLGHRSIEADIQKNKDDNESDVRYSQRIIEKHENGDE